jgi:hypothetical protein
LFPFLSRQAELSRRGEVRHTGEWDGRPGDGEWRREKIECGLPAPSPRGHQARADDACTPGFGEPSARLASQRFGSHVFGSQGQVHVALGSQVSCRSPDARSTFSAPGFNALLVRLEVGLIFQQSLVQSLECKFTTAGFHN